MAHFMKPSFSAMLIAVAVLAVSPLHARKKVTQPDPNFAATYPDDPRPEVVPNGAIFQPSYGYMPIISGARASHVGDMVTITLVESFAASKSANTTTSRSGGASIIPPTTGPLSFFKATDATASSSHNFKGTGTTGQSNSLSGEITATVARVFPDGTMLIRGEKIMTINRGDEHIRISGLVRPWDIDGTNHVLSTRIGDARISYTGTGDVARASRMGWLGHFFQMISPF
ncbi:MAG: flagellar basal body L-ring protein FlgH [Zymomonas mobilis]|uniref:Flagellar L-ring protein n=1 Tax=Zymomonas mobilis subsp. mobilis (strain ATCC 10988 / DSM 424 / LMG 404 / NCIMB 8938 / NRRL B-806 / ZM1) TaxID=555217 RepID=A0A0H3G2C6_ZYMMA|nr:flagellar basal body L-ring protein FlgH [Zymomonas mobilis]ACV75198.1 flagellar L-ring protein [Zymomonas mobilis subsp. mobilis NCIMB 11163]AEH62963.1 flagellar L-ring protein [Zymomonas mobilis subsp. mobilis ATCC 10988]AHB09985.1 flagellar basal body L-ring protein [Zymomonas mobilis subsp. mobilis str. CP4 = NRRL B-14023]AHJ70290.1 Basal body L-ring protein [Zymomonas mobilis subsp. mobilis NRRL B-12526]AHJ72145.1 Basal body L-ring protein [Zymomonas mobilis subsp. mobilis str. CP4 = N